MAIRTYTERYNSVMAAIEAIESGAQEYEIDGRSLRKGDLSALYKQEKYLYPRAVQESKSQGRVMRYKYVPKDC